MRKLIILSVLIGLFIFLGIQSPALAQISYYRSGDLIGKIIVNRQGQELGRIDDVIADRNGRIRYLLIRPGFGGMSDRWVPVPWNAADVAVRDGDVIVDLPRTTLRNAPYFRRGVVPDMGQWESRIMNYYGLGAYPNQYYPYQYEAPYYEPYPAPYYYYRGNEEEEEEEERERHAPRYHYYRGGEEEEGRSPRYYRQKNGKKREEEERERTPRYFKGNEEKEEREDREREHDRD